MLKQAVKQYLKRKCDARYENELHEKSDIYAVWYKYHLQDLDRQLVEKDHTRGKAFRVEVVRYSHLRSYILSGKVDCDIIIACEDDGTLARGAETLIRDYFAENPLVNMVYGDEDRLDEHGHLTDPWLKPDWSPDTFLSTFYFGSIFAIRTSELLLINPGERTAAAFEARASIAADSEEEKEAASAELDERMRSWIYGSLCLKIAQADGGFSRRNAGRFPVGHIPEVLFHASRKLTPWDSNLIRGSLTGRFSDESASQRLVSIIIPSKDNPKVLLDCIKSIEENTKSSPYEIIVVDNGSSEENRAWVERTLKVHGEKDIGGYEYVYEPMPFNFSKMCNLGARHANGELLLFLNDDITIAKPNWLSYLSEKAKLPYVGAVGTKLLYPNSDIIQHAGVVNVHAGPIHKLQYCSNKEVHYFGFNKGVRNVIAVTGACLMVRAEVFEQAGGFDEEHFAVAFNDIDLCLKIFELGYYNVVRNNMYLYHHESLSRGDDRKDQIKSLRLSYEQVALLKMHPALFERDPFYHPYLEQDPAVTRFRIAAEDASLRHPEYVTPQLVTGKIKPEWTDPVLRLGVEFANSLDRWLTGPYALHPLMEGQGYYIKGYSFVINADNAVYERKILLKNEQSGDVFLLPARSMYREDIAANLTDQINDKLTGFGAVITSDALPKGSYLVGMLADDRTSRRNIVNWSDVTLTVK